MTIRVEVEHLVLHDISLSQADRPRLLAAVERAIASQTASVAEGRDIVDAAVPVVRTTPFVLTSDRADGTHVDSLADGIATAATTAIKHLGGGTQ